MVVTVISSYCLYDNVLWCVVMCGVVLYCIVRCDYVFWYHFISFLVLIYSILLLFHLLCLDLLFFSALSYLCLLVFLHCLVFCVVWLASMCGDLTVFWREKKKQNFNLKIKIIKSFHIVKFFHFQLINIYRIFYLTFGPTCFLFYSLPFLFFSLGFFFSS